MSKPHLQATNGQAKNVASSDFRDTSISLKAKDQSTRTLDTHFKTNPNQQATNKTVFLTFDDGPSATSNQLSTSREGDVLHAWTANPSTPISCEKTLSRRTSIRSSWHDAWYKSLLSEQRVSRKWNERSSAYSCLCYRRLQPSCKNPYGSVPNLTYHQKVRLNQNGFIYWDWTIDSLDWRYKNSQYVPEVLNQLQMFEENKPWEPKVILMHDQPSTTNYLDSLIIQLKARGYTFAVINETMPPVQH